MASTVSTWTLRKLAEAIGGQLDGPAELEILRPVPAGSHDPSGITFAESNRYFEKVRGTSVGAVIVDGQLDTGGIPAIRSANPRMAFGAVLAIFSRPPVQEPGIHPTAVVHETARVDPTASVGPYAVVAAEAEIGPGTQVFPFCYVGERCRIGANCTLMPHSVLVQDVELGEETTVQPGAVVGTEGFGFAWDGSRHVRVPQAGTVSIGANAEIGANACIDRATAGATEIGTGVKIDNLVQIGHNVAVGEHSILAGQAGIAGSATIGKRNIFGGQARIKDHAKTCDDVVLGGGTGIMGDIEQPGQYFGFVAQPLRDGLRQVSMWAKLPEMAERIKALEAAIEALSKK